MYVDEVVAVKLDPCVNWDMTEDWESRLVIFPLKVLVLGIGVPWKDKANHIVIFFMPNVLL